MFKDRTLKDIMIVDNSASCFIRNLDNAIPIIPYIDNNADNELKDLEELLIWQSYKMDVRDSLRNIFKQPTLADYNSVDQACEEVLYQYNR